MLQELMDDEDEMRDMNLSSRPGREEKRRVRERDRLEREMERSELQFSSLLLASARTACEHTLPLWDASYCMLLAQLCKVQHTGKTAVSQHSLQGMDCAICLAVSTLALHECGPDVGRAGNAT